MWPVGDSKPHPTRKKTPTGFHVACQTGRKCVHTRGIYVKTTCPQCDAVLSVPDHASGKPLKCGNCGTIIPAATASGSDWISPKGWPKESRPSAKAVDSSLSPSAVAVSIERSLGTLSTALALILWLLAAFGAFGIFAGLSTSDYRVVGAGVAILAACMATWCSFLLVVWIILLLAAIARK